MLMACTAAFGESQFAGRISKTLAVSEGSIRYGPASNIISPTKKLNGM
jgi:hypothetical protein